LGGSKVVIELAEELELLGWKADVVSPADFPLTQGRDIYAAYPSNLRRHLSEYAHEYDVIDYDHVYLPYPRTEFRKDTLFVARSVLLAHHLESIRIPRSRALKSVLRNVITAKREARKLATAIRQAKITVAQADLVNVPNTHDKAELVKHGIPENKIVVLPFGIDRVRHSLINAISSEPPDQPALVFVGTFDNRKGATDFPRIVRDLARKVTGVRFRLIGTGSSGSRVLSHFDKNLRDRIEVVPRYEPVDLPGLLAGCSVGVFPSYIEGFPLGVLEMLAASIPVIAYDSPGPPMMLPAEYLVTAGDSHNLTRKAIALLRDPVELARARTWARERSRAFCWNDIAKRTDRIYRDCLERKRAESQDEATRSSRRAS